jgi:hypothetical protein
MQLDAAYDGLTIAEANQAERSVIEARTGLVASSESDSLNDYICSGRPAWHEDKGSYRDPSFFESMLML